MRARAQLSSPQHLVTEDMIARLGTELRQSGYVNELCGILQTGHILRIGGTKFSVLDLLGRGSFGIVYSVQSAHDASAFALKISNLGVCSATLAKMGSSISATAELEFLKVARHPSLLRLNFASVISNCVQLILDLEGTDFFTYLATHGAPSDEACQQYVNCLLNALIYMHSLNFAHRDVKIENLLLPNDRAIYRGKIVPPRLKLCDFGLVQICTAMIGCKTICGTLACMAPEVWDASVDSQYGFLVDVWGCGVVAYTLLNALPPFYDDNLRLQVLSGSFIVDETTNAAMSHFALDFVRACLVTVPAHRCSSRHAQHLPWLCRWL